MSPLLGHTSCKWKSFHCCVLHGLQICTRPLSVIGPAWADALLCTRPCRTMTHLINHLFLKDTKGSLSHSNHRFPCTQASLYTMWVLEKMAPLRPCSYKQVFVRGCRGRIYYILVWFTLMFPCHKPMWHHFQQSEPLNQNYLMLWMFPVKRKGREVKIQISLFKKDSHWYQFISKNFNDITEISEVYIVVFQGMRREPEDMYCICNLLNCFCTLKADAKDAFKHFHCSYPQALSKNSRNNITSIK